MSRQEASAALAAREAAAEVLERVHRQGAYLNLTLRAVLRHRGLAGRSAALASALAAGVLRWQARLDLALSRVSRRPLEEVEPRLLEILRVAAYEVGFSRGVPVPLACDLAVRAAGRLHRGAQAFANAVLRELVRQDALTLPVCGGPEDARSLAVAYSHPLWLVKRWLERFGEPATRALLEANNRPPPLCVRVNRVRASASEVLQRWRAAGLQAQPGRWLPEALLLSELPLAVDQLPGFAEGWFTPQSEAAMLAARAVAPQEHERLVDLCAAPGGKSTHLAEQTLDRARVMACDVHPGRTQLVAANARRLGLRGVAAVVADGRRPPVAHGGADAVLVDAPCTDLGIIGRRPDIRYRRRPEDLQRACHRQRELLAAAASLVRPGGRLVYSVCSFEPEETTEQVRWLVQRFREFEVEDVRPLLAAAAAGQAQIPPVETEPLRAEPGSGGWFTILPHVHQTDGFFVARFRRRGRAAAAGSAPAGYE